MKKIFSLFAAVLFCTSMFAAQGGTLTVSPEGAINPSSDITLSYDGTGTNFANWEPKCFIHAWLDAAEGQTFSKGYTTEWKACNGDADYEALDANRKMTYAGEKGKYTINLNLKSFFGVAEEDLAKIGKLGVIICTQYVGGNEEDQNKTQEFKLDVNVSGDPGKVAKFYVTGESLVGSWDPNKLPVYEESVTLPNLEANKEYAFKVTVDGTWNTAKGYSDLTDKTNLKGGGDNNIVFALKEAGAVTIKYTASEFTVTGNFVEKTVDPNAKFYITGETLVGSWDPDKLPVTSESYTFEDLAAGTYAFAVTVDGTWTTKKGFYDLTNKTNLTTDKDGNVVFTMTTLGDVTVKYTGTEFTVTGDIAPIVPTLTDGYYLIGDKYEWSTSKLTAAQLFAQTAQEGEYKLEITLTEGEKIKVAKVEADAIVSWYPNSDYNYIVDANHAGLMTIYFRPAGSAEEAWAAFGGNMYIEAKEATAISNTTVEGKAVKSIVNGMLVIEKAGVRYNVMGQIVK